MSLGREVVVDPRSHRLRGGTNITLLGVRGNDIRVGFGAPGGNSVSLCGSCRECSAGFMPKFARGWAKGPPEFRGGDYA